MPPTQRLDLFQGDLFQGRYRVVQQLGKGGMGAVYEVVDENTRRHRALKVMLPSMVADLEMRHRFRREATVAARIDSAHIAEVVDAGVDDASGAPFMVMELLKGQDLQQVTDKRGPLPPDEVAHYLWQASLALDKAHAAGVVHRDLKPENLYVTYRDDGAPWIKILDFGIAKVIAETANGMQTQGILGTPLFMSPEQIHGELDVKPQTDVYAVAHIAYALLVGEPYFMHEEETSKGVYQMVLKVSKGPMDPASQRAKRKNVLLPPAFDTWFEKGAAELAEERFARVSEAVVELARALQVQRPDSFAPSMQPYVSRPEWSLLPATAQQPSAAAQPVISHVPSTPKMVDDTSPMTNPLPVGFVSEGGQQQSPVAVVVPSDAPPASLDPLGRTMESEENRRGDQPHGPHAPATRIDATVIDQPALGSTVFEEPSFSPDQLEAALSSPTGAASGPAPSAAPTAQMPVAQPHQQPHQQGGVPSPASQSVQLEIPKKSNKALFIVLGALALVGLGVAIWVLGGMP